MLSCSGQTATRQHVRRAALCGQHTLVAQIVTEYLSECPDPALNFDLNGEIIKGHLRASWVTAYREVGLRKLALKAEEVWFTEREAFHH